MTHMLVIAACEREAAPFRAAGLSAVVSGVGRVNSAIATVLALQHEAYDCVYSVGFAGALPGSDLCQGDVVVATNAVYLEEGMMTPEGFIDLASMGFGLAEFFDGNAVACTAAVPEGLASVTHGTIATVATCSGTAAMARACVERTGAVAEAMEGAAVVHAARLSGIAAGELRAISNQTGNRAEQAWDVAAAERGLTRIAAALAAV
jgi:futalosine hydrolase